MEKTCQNSLQLGTAVTNSSQDTREEPDSQEKKKKRRRGGKKPFIRDINLEESVLHPVMTTVVKSNESQMLSEDKIQFSVWSDMMQLEKNKNQINHDWER